VKRVFKVVNAPEHSILNRYQLIFSTAML